MSWVDIVIIALIVLFVALGAIVGVQKSALGLGAFLVAFVIAFFLANIVAEALVNIEAIKNFVMAREGWSLYTMISEWMPENAGQTDSFVDSYFFKPIVDIVEAADSGLHTTNGTALYLAFGVLSVICGIGIFIVARLLLCIVTMIIKSYIPKEKSVVNRVFGAIIGIVRGIVLSFAITIIFTSLGGIGAVPAFDAVENEYENSVMGKYVYEASFAIKNNVYLPNEDMFNRLVNLSGLTITDGDSNKEDDLNNRLYGTKLDIYINLMNLNCAGGTGYSKDDHENLVVAPDVNSLLINYKQYRTSGFDVFVKGVMDYNKAAADGIRESLADADAAELRLYDEIIQGSESGSSESIYTIWGDLKNLIYNFEYNVDEYVSQYGVMLSQESIDAANIDIGTRYEAIKVLYNKLKEKYDELPKFGEFTVELPAKFIVDPNTLPPEMVEEEANRKNIYITLGNLNYTSDVYAIDEETGNIETSADVGTYAIDPSDYADSGFDVFVQSVLDFNTAAMTDLDTKLAGLNYDQLEEYVLKIVGADSSDSNSVKALWRSLLGSINSYNTKVHDYKEQIEAGELDDDGIAEANGDLTATYATVNTTFQQLKARYDAVPAIGSFTAELPQNTVLGNGQTEEPVDAATLKNQMQAAFGNLNYTAEVYTVNEETGEVEFDSEAAAESGIDTSAYGVAEVADMIDLLLAYNGTLMSNFETIFEDTEEDDIREYAEYIMGEIDSVKTLWETFLTAVGTYDETVTGYMDIIDTMDADGIDAANQSIDTDYAAVGNAYDALKAKYESVTPFGTMSVELFEKQVLEEVTE